MKKFFIHTFGCQMNVHDSEKMAGLLSEIGYEKTSDDSSADLILFNTCTVRDHAHQKALSEIGRAVGRKKNRKDLIVGVCGCVAQLEKENLFNIYPNLDIVFGPDQIYRLMQLLQETGNKKYESRMATELIEDGSEYHWLKGEGTKVEGVTAFVTIMKGCNNHCSFCIVPTVRGSEISRPADDIVKEIKELCQSGVKEVTLLGQNVNSYEFDFTKLLRRISEETEILRLRYTSPHPKDLKEDLILEHASNRKLCRHMHLPLQAGSDKILKLMRRSYNKRQFIDKSEALRKAALGVEITTDIIVGFPGETEEDFLDTMDVVKKVAFDGMFAFKYSPRPGTKAAELNDDVKKEIKEERLSRLLELNAAIWKEKTKALVGSKQEILVEGLSKKQKVQNEVQVSGRTFGNKIVNFAGNLNMIGHIVGIEITDAGANSLKGKIII